MPAPTIAQLRVDLPEFGSVSKYPDSAVSFWLDIAALMLQSTRWNDTPVATGKPTQLYVGTELFVAHHLVIEAQASRAAAKGGIPGTSQTGPMSSKSIGPVSVSYDAGSALELGAGHWNLSVYGTRFIRLARMVGAGGIQVGIGCAPYGAAWPGPNCWPAPGGSSFC